ncbi:Hypothetical predicted protein [Pelobates cultripes]|uniref:Uncharacterized protein n=1 Tax=Pelobates cultripes TaxID=61616 RepID=A0AAD1RAS8_PELCU|nr:Hypothetical predicted protein [Pelobates cultripes]
MRTSETEWGNAFCGIIFLSQLFACSAGFTTQAIHRSSVRFLNPPDQLVNGHLLQILYHCETIQVVRVEVLASSLTKSLVGIFKKSWVCNPGLGQKKRDVKLDFPDQLVYREDYFLRHPIQVFDAYLRAWISEYPDHVTGADWNSYNRAITRTLHFIDPVPLYSRPYKRQQRTLRWDQDIIWRIKKDRIPQCEAEQDAVHLLRFLYACTGENFGVLRKLHPYRDRILEAERLTSIFSPRCSLATWIYLVEWCPVSFCGVLYYLDDNNEYHSPSILLTNKGYLHIQVNLVSDEPHAFQMSIPLNTWCQVQLTLDHSAANLTVICEELQSKMGYR